MGKLLQQYKKNNIYISALVFPIETFSLAGNINVYWTGQGINNANYFNHINYKGKSADCDRKQTHCHPSLPS